MLAELRIENLVLIERVHLELDRGLNAFTGETGAGKSLLVDALGLLFGGHGEPDLVRPGASQAEVSARFVLSEEELINALQDDFGIIFDPDSNPKSKSENRKCAELVVSRIVPREGRSRAYANGRPVAVAALKGLGDRLIDVHGQHENQSLLRPATRLEILDRFAEALAERAAVRRAHQEARRAASALAELRQAARDRQGREDLYRFQLKELDEAELDEIEPDALEGDLKLLRGAERIREAALAAAEGLDGDDESSAAARMARALKGIESLGDAGAEARALCERLDSLLAESRDLSRDLNALAEKARSDPERLADLEERRARWRALERKHGRDLQGLRTMRDEWRRQLAELGRLDVQARDCEEALARAVDELRVAAGKLSRKRKAAAKELERRAGAELADLGLSGARFSVALLPHTDASPGAAARDDERRPVRVSEEGPGLATSVAEESARMLPPNLHASGAESAELFFSANPELPPRPLSECASGGELSRVMLALKGVLARAGGADRLPVVVFDEMDSGVGGRLGAVLGRKLAALSQVRQVLCVTHQPQLAVYAQRQIKVEKTRSKETGSSAVTATFVDGASRVDELALMLRGEGASERTRAEAAEMLEAAQGEAPNRPRARRAREH